MVGQVIADRYELKDVVGTGGMSSVFCAHDTLLERDVALKLLHEHHSRDEDYVQRFRHEARAVAQLSHPSIVTVIDRGEDGGRQFIVFELVDGQNLKQLVEAGPLSVRRTLELGSQVARALAFAHAQGLVHRDVKPQNVLITDDGRPKVTDFGIARSLDAVGLTQTGTVLGTSHYIAPEQARGERVDTKTDVYAFGVVLFEMLTGAVPYDGESFLAVAMQHVNAPVPSVLERRPDCPLRLAALVERCMAKEPTERPAMEDCVRELDAALADLDARPDGDATMIVPAPESLRRTRRPRVKRTRWPLAVALVALIAVAAAAALFAFGGDGDGGGPGSGTAVPLRAVASYDPDGDGVERDDLVPLATDGNPGTYWSTEGYDDFAATKPGVGLVLDAGADGNVEGLVVRSDTPGFTAEVKTGNSPTSFDRTVAGAKTAAGTTTWQLDGADGRYLLLWITSVAQGTDGRGRAHVNEVTARS
jgi:eukaryotic-like serine/threonine-protein kinase